MSGISDAPAVLIHRHPVGGHDIMTTEDFARRHGYERTAIAYGKHDYIPEWVRVDAGLMLVGNPEDHSDVKRFARAVLETLRSSPWLWDWFRTVQPIPKVRGRLEKGSSAERDRNEAVYRMLDPIRDCDWRLFYAVVETVCERWRLAGTTREQSVAPEFNSLLRSHGIPWMLQGGLVIPVADAEFAEDLEYAREASSSSGLEHASNPHVLIRDALQAFYRKPDGPDISAACVHAWGAWKAAAGTASGFGARDKRSFDFVKEKYPRLYDTMAAWQELAEAGRHPESEGFPTESETRFIVMLCVNAVRLLNSTRNNEADA